MVLFLGGSVNYIIVSISYANYEAESTTRTLGSLNFLILLENKRCEPKGNCIGWMVVTPEAGLLSAQFTFSWMRTTRSQERSLSIN